MQDLKIAIEGDVTPEQAEKIRIIKQHYDALSLLVGTNQDQEQSLSAVLKTVISAPISESILRADSSSLKPDTVWISLTCSWCSCPSFRIMVSKSSLQMASAS